MKLNSKQICYILLVLIVGYLLYYKNNGKVSKFGADDEYIYICDMGGPLNDNKNDNWNISFGNWIATGNPYFPLLIQSNTKVIARPIETFVKVKYDRDAEFIVLTCEKENKTVTFKNNWSGARHIIPGDVIAVTGSKYTAGGEDTSFLYIPETIKGGPWYMIIRNGKNYTFNNNELQETGWGAFDDAAGLNPLICKFNGWGYEYQVFTIK